jgi:hypothetical protein
MYHGLSRVNGWGRRERGRVSMPEPLVRWPHERNVLYCLAPLRHHLPTAVLSAVGR